MQYKGFVATYQYVRNLGLFVAEVHCQQDTISFSAQTMDQLALTMVCAVDNYLEQTSKPPLPVVEMSA
ncbi:MAG: hypothetical protein AB7V32_02795 [Candidatus Berkiella sp.]